MFKATKNKSLTERPIPEHIAIIMDGNGRYAKMRSMPRIKGHYEGMQNVKRIVRHAADIKLKYLTLYAFSTENWKRPKDEVDAIMELFDKNLDEVRDFIEENIRVMFIGDRTLLSPSLQKKMKSVEEDSKDFDSMTLVLAINYGGQDEITRAVRDISLEVRAGTLEPEKITREIIERHLDTKGIPPVDLIIRPSGEQRISNFLIWQSAYAEYIFSDILWPDYKPEDLEDAVYEFMKRNRRFGGV